MKFDWDNNKAKNNVELHQVTFEEATLVFNDEWAIEEYDDTHSGADEKRFTIIGLAEMRLLRVTYTIIGDEEDGKIIRLISAREAEGLDKKGYEHSRNEFDW